MNVDEFSNFISNFSLQEKNIMNFLQYKSADHLLIRSSTHIRCLKKL